MIEQYLLENYEKGEPIFLSDLCMEGMTEENLRYHLKTARRILVTSVMS